MKNGWVWVLAAAVVVLGGCQNAELVTCHQDNQLLQAQTESLQQQLDQANVKIQQKDQEVERINAESADMQTQAMGSIMSMLQKEEERSKRLQETIAQKDRQLKAETEKNATLKQTVSQLQQEVESLKGQIAQRASDEQED